MKMIKVTYKCRNCGEEQVLGGYQNEAHPDKVNLNHNWYAAVENNHMQQCDCSPGVIGFAVPIRVEIVEVAE